MKRTDNWYEKYQRVKLFTVNTGGLPALKDDPKLCKWVYCQRKKKDHLTVEQKWLLEELSGWTWDVQVRPDWDEYYQRVLTIITTTGELSRKVNSVEFDWLYRQRKHKNRLTCEQRKKLEALPGFMWEVKPRCTWMECYQRVVWIIETTGELPKPKSADNNSYVWLCKQLDNIDKLTGEQQLLLGTLSGVHVDVKKKFTWKENYDRTIHTIKTTGLNQVAPVNHIVWEWLSWQQTHRNILTMKQRQLLERIPGFTWLAQQDIC